MLNILKNTNEKKITLFKQWRIAEPFYQNPALFVGSTSQMDDEGDRLSIVSCTDYRPETFNVSIILSKLKSNSNHQMTMKSGNFP